MANAVEKNPQCLNFSTPLADIPKEVFKRILLRKQEILTLAV